MNLMRPMSQRAWRVDNDINMMWPNMANDLVMMFPDMVDNEADDMVVRWHVMW